MAESEWEQLIYGDVCKHGTAIGTPGGADFLCGLCESGMDYWIPEPSFQVFMAFNPDHDGSVPATRWRDRYLLSDVLSQELIIQSIIQMYVGLMEDPEASDVWEQTLQGMEWEVKQVADGYWCDKENLPLGDWERS
jgi:hypothetical protein